MHSDEWSTFVNEKIHDICALLDIKQSYWKFLELLSTFHCDDVSGTVNHTWLQVRGTLKNKAKTECSLCLSSLIHACNGSRHGTEGFLLISLMSGRHPRLPVELVQEVQAVAQDIASKTFHQETPKAACGIGQMGNWLKYPLAPSEDVTLWALPVVPVECAWLPSIINESWNCELNMLYQQRQQDWRPNTRRHQMA